MTSDSIKIAIVGDCSDWNLNNLTKESIPSEILEPIKESDLFLFNLEGPIINSNINAQGAISNWVVKKILKVIGKIQPTVTNTESILDILDITKKNVACLANNHMLDAGTEGIEFTLKSLKKKKILFIGAGRNLDEASKPLVVNVKGKKIGILNYNFVGWNKFGFFINIFGAGKRKPGANFANRQKIAEDIMSLSDKVDHIITIMHTGRELKESFSIKELQFLESLKVDLIAIHHAHIAQSISSNKIVSCGDFIFNYPEHLPENRLANLILCKYDKNIDVSKIELEIEGGIACTK